MKADLLRHVKPNTLRTCRFHGKNRPKYPSDLMGFDLVLTTYSTLSAELKSGGVLHQIDWYRVVLDEGKDDFHIRDRKRGRPYFGPNLSLTRGQPIGSATAVLSSSKLQRASSQSVAGVSQELPFKTA